MNHEWISKGSSTNVILPHTKWGVPNKARLKLLSQALVKLHLEYPTGFFNHSHSIKVNSLCKGCRDELLECDRNDDIALITLKKKQGLVSINIMQRILQEERWAAYIKQCIIQKTKECKPATDKRLAMI